MLKNAFFETVTVEQVTQGSRIETVLFLKRQSGDTETVIKKSHGPGNLNLEKSYRVPDRHYRFKLQLVDGHFDKLSCTCK